MLTSQDIEQIGRRQVNMTIQTQHKHNKAGVMYMMMMMIMYGIGTQPQVWHTTLSLAHNLKFDTQPQDHQYMQYFSGMDLQRWSIKSNIRH